MSFVPLYVRSEYSMLQSACSISTLLEKCVEENITSIAVTDKEVMHGAIKFYKACKKNNIKPIIGLEITFSLNGILSGLLLYAMNQVGYRNLMKLSSIIKIMNKPIDFEKLRTFSNGVLAIYPGEQSSLYRFYKTNAESNFSYHYQMMKETFANLYFGITLTSNELLQKFDNLFEYCLTRNIKMVALTPTYFINQDDLDAYTALKSLKNGGTLANITENESNSYFHSVDEVQFLFGNYPELILETEHIASLCNVEIEFGTLQLPKYQENLDGKQYLLDLGIKGLKKRAKQGIYADKQVYINRFKYEYDTIVQMGFEDYFLIVWDYVKYAKQNNIYVGPGRGSAGASLMAYCLGITEIDPIKYNLLFERFLNKERVTMPDIDIDFPDDLRNDVIRYVGQKYGKDKVAHIAAFGTFQAKVALNDCARIYRLPENRLKNIVKYIQQDAIDDHGVIDLKATLEHSETLKTLMEDYEDIRKVLTTAMKLQGFPRNLSTHAAGMLVTKNSLTTYTPIDNGLDDVYQTQYEASDCEELGLLKMDFLGLKNLTNIASTVELIKKDNPSFTLPKEENDKETYLMLSRGDVSGVFQLESSGMRKVIMQMKVRTLDDIIQALALYRPGPMDMIPDFIRRKFGEERISYPHNDLMPILRETYGTIVYQEQIMQIAQKFAGYSLGKADILRRAVSKKKKEVLERERINFVESSIKQGYNKNTAEEIYDTIVKFANYGFNKAHSVAYAKVAYLTAYLKCHYPAYYISTLMTSCLGSETNMNDYTREAMNKGIEILPPDINNSTNVFLCLKGKILYPLTSVKDFGETKLKDLINVRKEEPFKDYKDFIKRTKNILPKSVIQNLIYAGALDQFGLTKKAMIENIEKELQYLEYSFLPNIKKVEYTDEEYSYEELMEKEKTVLKVNLSYNFFKQYGSIYKSKHLQKIQQAKENYNIRTFGKIYGIKVIKTKKGDDMAFATLEDDTSKISLTIFPNNYRLMSNIKDGAIVVVCGNVQLRNELQIVVDNIEILK